MRFVAAADCDRHKSLAPRMHFDDADAANEPRDEVETEEATMQRETVMKYDFVRLMTFRALRLLDFIHTQMEAALANEWNREPTRR